MYAYAAVVRCERVQRVSLSRQHVTATVKFSHLLPIGPFVVGLILSNHMISVTCWLTPIGFGETLRKA